MSVPSSSQLPEASIPTAANPRPLEFGDAVARNPGRRAWMIGKPSAQAAQYAAGLVRVALARPSPPNLAESSATWRAALAPGPNGHIMGCSVCGDLSGWHCAECVVAAGRCAQCLDERWGANGHAEHYEPAFLRWFVAPHVASQLGDLGRGALEEPKMRVLP